MKLTQPQYLLMLDVLANKPKAVQAEQIETLNDLCFLGHVAMNDHRYVVTGRGGCALRRSGYMGSLDGVVVQQKIKPIWWLGSASDDARSSL
jgi:hypothetical protein